MRQHAKSIVVLLVSLTVGSLVASQIQQTASPVLRARRPTFERKDWDGVFFENLFTEALKGERPKSVEPSTPPTIAGDDSVPDAPPSSASWSAIIDRSVLEDEVKRLQILLNSQVTTPAKFSAEHNQVRETFAMLSMLFGVIRQYDGEVRWKDVSDSAQTTFARAAANSRTGSQQAYAYAKKSKEDLMQLVRGGAFPELPQIEPLTDWATVVDRNPVMRRLEFAVRERLKEPTSNENAFQADAELVLSEASLIAAMGRILGSAEMLDADDESYVQLANNMVSAASSMATAAKAGDFNGVSAGMNAVTQACDACHAEWR